MLTTLQLRSPAKVNIGLQIRDRRPDGYHTIHTIFQELEFHDTVRMTIRDSGCRITASVDWVPTDESNICCRAVRVLKERYAGVAGIRIELEKQIPAGAGLGGGSGNAAAVLKGLNHLYDLRLSVPELERTAAAVGADVPFFIRGGTQVGDGIGDELTPLSVSGPWTFLLIVPALRINTAWAYGQVKKNLNGPRSRINFDSFFQGANPSWELFENDFERIVIPAYPEIGEIKQRLLAAGAVYASLSGSGSTVFGVFDDEAGAMLAESDFKKSYQTILTHPAATVTTTSFA
ncbi:MAG: 4-(cytidine 5'-diphospho)-2-C-methyl-D-erythritol kinase [Candidatus Neomarinimicrobiota bacterium]